MLFIVFIRIIVNECADWKAVWYGTVIALHNKLRRYEIIFIIIEE